jgi:hypothetical protein
MARGKDHCQRLPLGDEQRLVSLKIARRQAACPKNAKALQKLESLSSLGTNQRKRRTD